MAAVIDDVRQHPGRPRHQTCPGTGQILLEVAAALIRECADELGQHPTDLADAAVAGARFG
jgi:hypothetical protein